MLSVLITVDAETYPLTPGWREDGLAADMKRDLYGEIGLRTVGLDYQLKTFAKHKLKANFMLESLFAGAPEVGMEPLQKIVRSIAIEGHDIQLHPHAEWIAYAPALEIPYRSHLLRGYSLQEQYRIISFAKKQLEDAGAGTPIAFRAGGFAANSDTMHALELCGVTYDTSYNACYGGCRRNLPPVDSFGHATRYGKVQELPVAVFEDSPSHLRPLQLCACSFSEMSHCLNEAERTGWEFLVVVSHSFEMLTRRRHLTKPPMIRERVVDRFEKFCTFLSLNRDRFKTVGFSDLQLSTAPGPKEGLKGKLFHTAGRMVEQAIGRLQSR